MGKSTQDLGMFRDDHEAALERIAALESELKRALAEKDELAIELDETRHALERAQPNALATTTSAPLATRPRLETVRRLVRSRHTSLMAMIVGMFAIVVGLGLFGYFVHPPQPVFALLLLLVPVVVFARIGSPSIQCPTCKLPTSKKLELCQRCQARLGS